MPDTFTNWLKFTPAGQVGYRRAYIDLPAFSYTGLTWIGASECVAQFNFSASQNFILLNRPTKPGGANYGLCIRYRTGEVVTRYKLWGDTAFMLNDDGAPLYNGQLIKKNFVLEIWSLNGQTTASQTTAIRMFSSVRSIPTDVLITTDYALAIGAEFTTMANTNTYSLRSTDLVVDLNPNVLATGAFSNWPESVTGALFGAGSCLQDTRFTGKKYVQTTGAASIDGTVAGSGSAQPNYTMFMVCAKYAEALSTREYLFNDGIDGLSIADVGTGMYVQAGGSFIGGAMTMALNEEVIIQAQVQHSPFPSYIKKDDGAIEDGDLTGFISPVTGLWRVGGGTSGFTSMNVARILIYKALLSDDVCTTIRQYLSNQYLGGFALPLTFNSGVAWLDNV